MAMIPRFSAVAVAAAAVLLAGLLSSGLVGCQDTESVGGGRPDGLPPEGGSLRLMVVDDPAMAAAIGRLRTEFRGQSGWDLTVQETSASELAAGKPIAADALVFPSALLGALARRDLASPLPRQPSYTDQAEGADVFELVRSTEVSWAGKAVAVPFGSPVLTCYYRADLLEKLGKKPPTTWTEYSQLAALLADRKDLAGEAIAGAQSWHGALEPLGPGWAGITLLARAAAYASHRGNYSTLFNFDTMEPLINGPPFVRALEELVSVAGSGKLDPLACDPDTVRKAFWNGQCGMALTWPTAADEDLATPDGDFRVGFAELPGSRDVYNVSDQVWETRRDGEPGQVPLLAIAGRLGTVLPTSQWPAASLQMLRWLSEPQWSEHVSPSSPWTTLFRRSHLNNARKWVEQPAPISAAVEYALLTEQILSGEQRLFAIRIPGRTEYLAALDRAVQQAAGGELLPKESLDEAASRWKEITGRLGVDEQRKAYSASLGLD